MSSRKNERKKRAKTKTAPRHSHTKGDNTHGAVLRGRKVHSSSVELLSCFSLASSATIVPNLKSSNIISDQQSDGKIQRHWCLCFRCLDCIDGRLRRFSSVGVFSEVVSACDWDHILPQQILCDCPTCIHDHAYLCNQPGIYWNKSNDDLRAR